MGTSSGKSPLLLPNVHDSSRINVQDDYFENSDEGAANYYSTNHLGSDVVDFNFRGNRKFTIKARKLKIILTILTVGITTITVTSLPLLDNTVDKYHDIYPVLLYTSFWFAPFYFVLIYLNKRLLNPLAETKPSVPHRVMALIGLLNAVSGVLIVVASDTKRTTGSLQALMGTSSIPITVIFRYVLLRKGVGRARLVCAGIVLIGLFISLEPEIFNIMGTSGPERGAVTGAMKVIWPMIFLLGFVPDGIVNVITEREIKKKQTQSLAFLAWTMTYRCVFTLFFVWTDFIPRFGAAESIHEFGRNMLYSLKCMHFADSTCMMAVAYYFVFITAYCFGNLVAVLLLKYAEGAIWLVLVQALVRPLGCLFFILFSVAPPAGQDHGTLHLAPRFDLTVAFRFLGLAILVPTVIFYNYFGEKERKVARQQTLSE